VSNGLGNLLAKASFGVRSPVQLIEAAVHICKLPAESGYYTIKEFIEYSRLGFNRFGV